MFLEVSQAFGGLEDWQTWSDSLPELRDLAYIQELAQSILATGFIDPALGTVRPEEIVNPDGNYREGLAARGACCRHRALLKPAVDYLLSNGWCSPVYLSEHVSAFGERAPIRFPYLLRSEYFPDLAARQQFPSVRHEDPMHLNLPNRCFDMYIAADTMVYSPDPEGFLKEAHRILRRGGMFLATFPFRYGDSDTEVYATLMNGELVEVYPALFHDDPLFAGRKRRVFFIPGWDIIDIAHSAGFSSVQILALSSRTHGIVGAEIATIFVLRAIV
jgi:SAM-dependent methyltransferase